MRTCSYLNLDDNEREGRYDWLDVADGDWERYRLLRAKVRNGTALSRDLTLMHIAIFYGARRRPGPNTTVKMHPILLPIARARS